MVKFTLIINALSTLSALHQCNYHICITDIYNNQYQYWPEQWSWWLPNGWLALVCAAAVSWCRRTAERSPTTASWKCYRTDDLRDEMGYPCPFHRHPDICDAPNHRQLQTVKAHSDSSWGPCSNFTTAALTSVLLLLGLIFQSGTDLISLANSHLLLLLPTGTTSSKKCKASSFQAGSEWNFLGMFFM